MGVVMEPIDEFLDAFVDDRVVGDVVYPRIELRRGGQLAVEQHVRRFQERAPLGQLLDRIAAVAQDPLVAVDVADRAAAGGGVQEPRVVCREPGIVVGDLDLAQVDRSDRAVLDGELVRLAGSVVGDGQGALRHANRPGKWLAKDNHGRTADGNGRTALSFAVLMAQATAPKPASLYPTRSAAGAPSGPQLAAAKVAEQLGAKQVVIATPVGTQAAADRVAARRYDFVCPSIVMDAQGHPAPYGDVAGETPERLRSIMIAHQAA